MALQSCGLQGAVPQVMGVMQAEMAGAPETAAILDSLNSQRADARERQAAMERQIREEARRLREGLAGAMLC